MVSLSTARKPSSVQRNEAVSCSLTCPAQSKGDSLQKWWGHETGLLIIPTDCSCSSARNSSLGFFILKFANTSGGGVCAGLHDTAAVCRSFEVGSKHFPGGDVYKLRTGNTQKWHF